VADISNLFARTFCSMKDGRKSKKNSRKGMNKKPATRRREARDGQAQDSEYRNLLKRVERRKDAAQIKKIAARLESEADDEGPGPGSAV
jgi:hypothetical protein